MHNKDGDFEMYSYNKILMEMEKRDILEIENVEAIKEFIIDELKKGNIKPYMNFLSTFEIDLVWFNEEHSLLFEYSPSTIDFNEAVLISKILLQFLQNMCSLGFNCLHLGHCFTFDSCFSNDVLIP